MLFTVFQSQERSDSLQQAGERNQGKITDSGQKPDLSVKGKTSVPEKLSDNNKALEPQRKLSSTSVTKEFLLGIWSWDVSCATAIAIEFKRNGKYEDSISTGSFTLTGDQVAFSEAKFFEGEWVEEDALIEMGKSLDELKASGHLDDRLGKVVRINSTTMRLNGVELFKCSK